MWWWWWKLKRHLGRLGLIVGVKVRNCRKKGSRAKQKCGGAFPPHYKGLTFPSQTYWIVVAVLGRGFAYFANHNKLWAKTTSVCASKGWGGNEQKLPILFSSQPVLTGLAVNITFRSKVITMTERKFFTKFDSPMGFSPVANRNAIQSNIRDCWVDCLQRFPSNFMLWGKQLSRAFNVSENFSQRKEYVVGRSGSSSSSRKFYAKQNTQIRSIFESERS